MIVRQISRILLATLLGLAIIAGTGPARAGYVYDLTVTGNWPGSGSIGFDALNGSSVIDGVSAFEFRDSARSFPNDYVLVDILSVSWLIDATTFDLISLELIASLAPPVTFITEIKLLLTLSSSSHIAPCLNVPGPLPGSIICRTGGGVVGTSPWRLICSNCSIYMLPPRHHHNGVLPENIIGAARRFPNRVEIS